MKINPQINFRIRNGIQVPIYRVNEQRDVHFVPMFVDQGQDISNRLSFNKVFFERVFSSEKTMILKTIDWEEQMIAFDLNNNKEVPDISKVSDLEAKKLVFKRKYKIGTYFVGKVLNFQMQTAFKLGRFIRQKINSDITVYFSNKQIWDSENQKIRKAYLYCFFTCPQLAPNNILYVRNVNIYLDHYSRYICHVITFSSLDDTFKKYGRNVESQIQFANPGSVAILPKIAPILNYNPQVPQNFRTKEILFFEPDKIVNWSENGVSKSEKLFIIQKNSKRLYIDDFYFKNTKPITNFQNEIDGFAGILSFEIYGRKIFKRSLNEGLIIGRSQRLFTHENLPFQTTPLSISKSHENDWIILSSGRAIARFWNDYRKEKGLDYSPDAKRNQQFILRFDKKLSEFQNVEWNIVQNEKNDIKQKLTNKNVLIYDKRRQFQFSENEIIDSVNKKLIINENDFLKSTKMTFAQFNNINADLMSKISRLELSLFLLTNHKKIVTEIISDSLGLLGGLVGKFTKFFSKSAAPILTGFSALKYIANLGAKYSPDSLFFSKNILKLSSKINIAFPRKAIEFLANNLPYHEKLYIPLEFLQGSWSNTFSQFFAGENMRVILNFELTEKFFNKNGLAVDSQKLDTQEDFLPNEIYETQKTNEQGFIIDKIICKTASARDLKFSFWNGVEMQNYFHIFSQAKFSKIITELETILFLGSFNENLSNQSKFNANIVDSQKLQAFSLASYLSKIEILIDSDNKISAQKQAKNQVLTDLIFEKEKIFETIFENLNQETKIVNNILNFEINFSQKYQLLKSLKFTKSDGTKSLVFSNENELSNWIVNQFVSKVDVFFDLKFIIKKNSKFDNNFWGEFLFSYQKYRYWQEILTIEKISENNFENNFVLNKNEKKYISFLLNLDQTFEKRWTNYYFSYYEGGTYVQNNRGFTTWPLIKIYQNLDFDIEINNYNFNFDTISEKIKLSFNLLKIAKNTLNPIFNDSDISKSNVKLTFKAKLELKGD